MMENLRAQRKKRTYCWSKPICTSGAKFSVGAATIRARGCGPLTAKISLFSSWIETWKAGVESVGSGVPSERKPLEGVWKPKVCAGMGTAKSMVKNCLSMPSALEELYVVLSASMRATPFSVGSPLPSFHFQIRGRSPSI